MLMRSIGSIWTATFSCRAMAIPCLAISRQDANTEQAKDHGPWECLRRYMTCHILAHHRSGGAMQKRRQQFRDGFASLMARAGRQWRRAVDRRLQPFGLTEATWLPLIHLARAPVPMRQKDLAASLVLDGSSVVRLLDALETSELIERREEDGDRRARIIVRPGADCRSSSRSRPSRARCATPLSSGCPTTRSRSRPRAGARSAGIWRKSRTRTGERVQRGSARPRCRAQRPIRRHRSRRTACW